MSVMIQLRNVPDALHRKLKARAAMAGKSLSDYIIDEMKDIANRPTWDEMLERLHSRERVELPVSAAELIRAERDSR
jgi:plasmid stability protein